MKDFDGTKMHGVTIKKKLNVSEWSFYITWPTELTDISKILIVNKKQVLKKLPMGLMSDWHGY
jgi:hypothetical protein